MKKLSVLVLFCLSCSPLCASDEIAQLTSPFPYTEESIYNDTKPLRVSYQPKKEYQTLVPDLKKRELPQISLSPHVTNHSLIERLLQLQGQVLGISPPGGVIFHNKQFLAYRQTKIELITPILSVPAYAVAMMTKRPKTEAESYPDYAIGSRNWFDDILGAYKYWQDALVARRFFQPESFADVDTNLDLYLAYQPKNFIGELDDSFDARGPNTPYSFAFVEIPLLPSKKQVLEPFSQRSIGLLVTLNPTFPQFTKLEYGKKWNYSREQYPSYKVGSVEWSDDILEAHLRAKEYEYVNALFYTMKDPAHFYEEGFAETVEGELLRMAKSLDDGIESETFPIQSLRSTLFEIFPTYAQAKLPTVDSRLYVVFARAENTVVPTKKFPVDTAPAYQILSQKEACSLGVMEFSEVEELSLPSFYSEQSIAVSFGYLDTPYIHHELEIVSASLPPAPRVFSPNMKALTKAQMSETETFTSSYSPASKVEKVVPLRQPATLSAPKLYHNVLLTFEELAPMAGEQLLVSIQQLEKPSLFFQSDQIASRYEPDFFDIAEWPDTKLPSVGEVGIESRKAFAAVLPNQEKDQNTLFSYSPELHLAEPSITMGTLSAIGFDPSELLFRKEDRYSTKQILTQPFCIISLLEERIAFIRDTACDVPILHPGLIETFDDSQFSASLESYGNHIYDRKQPIAPFTITSPKTCHQATLQPETIVLASLFDDFCKRTLSAFKAIAKEGIFPNQTMLESSFNVRNVDSYVYDCVVTPYETILAQNLETGFFKGLAPLFTAYANVQGLEIPKAPMLASSAPFPDAAAAMLFESKPFSSFFGVKDQAARINRNMRLIHLNILQLPTLEELACDSLGDDFSIRVKVLPKMTQDGYVFAAQIRPFDKDGLYSLPHHVYFILDCSSSAEKHRFETYKSGILQSLNYLDENALFHIIALDGSTRELHPDGLRVTKGSVALARKFLSRTHQSSRSQFSEFHNLITQIQKRSTKGTELHSAYLLSNGKFMKNVRMHRDSLESLLISNSDSFSLHTAAISDHNNIGMLKWLASLNHGEFFHCQTHSSFPRKFSILAKRLKRPLAHDIHISQFSSEGMVRFFHDSNYAPHLYCDKGYTFYGTTRELKDIDIIIQGKAGEKWVNITKTLPLRDAARARSRIEKDIAEQQALFDLGEYVKTGSQEALYSAKDLLDPFDVDFPAK